MSSNCNNNSSFSKITPPSLSQIMELKIVHFQWQVGELTRYCLPPNDNHFERVSPNHRSWWIIKGAAKLKPFYPWKVLKNSSHSPSFWNPTFRKCCFDDRQLLLLFEKSAAIFSLVSLEKPIIGRVVVDPCPISINCRDPSSSRIRTSHHSSFQVHFKRDEWCITWRFHPSGSQNRSSANLQ